MISRNRKKNFPPPVLATLAVCFGQIGMYISWQHCPISMCPTFHYYLIICPEKKLFVVTFCEINTQTMVFSPIDFDLVKIKS